MNSTCSLRVTLSFIGDNNSITAEQTWIGDPIGNCPIFNACQKHAFFTLSFKMSSPSPGDGFHFDGIDASSSIFLMAVFSSEYFVGWNPDPSTPTPGILWVFIDWKRLCENVSLLNFSYSFFKLLKSSDLFLLVYNLSISSCKLESVKSASIDFLL